MFWEQLLLSIALVFLVIVLLGIRILIKKNGRMQRSCTSKHRIIHDKNLNCPSCNKGPDYCALDDKEHHQYIHGNKNL